MNVQGSDVFPASVTASGGSTLAPLLPPWLPMPGTSTALPLTTTTAVMLETTTGLSLDLEGDGDDWLVGLLSVLVTSMAFVVSYYMKR